MKILFRFNEFPLFVTKILTIDDSNAIFGELKCNLTIINKILNYNYNYKIIQLYNYNTIISVIVATDEGPSPKLALREGGSRGNIESQLPM